MLLLLFLVVVAFVVEAVVVIFGGGVADALDGGAVGGHLLVFGVPVSCVSLCVWLVRDQLFFVLRQ